MTEESESHCCIPESCMFHLWWFSFPAEQKEESQTLQSFHSNAKGQEGSDGPLSVLVCGHSGCTAWVLFQPLLWMFCSRPRSRWAAAWTHTNKTAEACQNRRLQTHISDFPAFSDPVSRQIRQNQIKQLTLSFLNLHPEESAVPFWHLVALR